MRKFLEKLFAWIRSIFRRTSAEVPLPQAILPEETEEALIHADWAHRDVLIGSFRNGAQFQACMEKNFYYIPAYLVEEWDRPIHFIAAFQTPRMFRDRAGIHFYGRVRKEEKVSRSSIREVPQTHGNPEDPYYRYEIEAWLPLQKPILPKESAFVRAFTNLFLLEKAQYIPELLLDSEEEYRLFVELKRREGTRGPGFALGEIKVLLDGKTIRLCPENGAESRCTVQDFEKRPVATFRKLYEEAFASVLPPA